MKIDAAALEKARDEARARRDRLALAVQHASPEHVSALRSEWDRAIGYHTMLETLFDTHCRFPVEPGTVMHGLDVSRMDWMTRAKVMSRNLATIYALGGRPDPE